MLKFLTEPSSLQAASQICPHQPPKTSYSPPTATRSMKTRSVILSVLRFNLGFIMNILITCVIVLNLVG